MKKLSLPEIQSTLIDVTQYDLEVTSSDATQTGPLPRLIADLLSGGPGYCVCYGTGQFVKSHGRSVHDPDGKQMAHDLLESLYRSALALIDVRKVSVIQRLMTIGKMDVDGFNLNQSFSHDGQIASRAFMTAKCIHFDAATPIIANVYGLNDNIQGGLPLICDVQKFCRDKSLSPRSLVENIPNNYNIVIKREYYDELLNDYSFAIDVDLESDIVMVSLRNEIECGAAHGATPPEKVDPALPASRPIRHFEHQYTDESHYEEWYEYYGLGTSTAGDYAGENLSLDYHGTLSPSFEHIVKVQR